MNSAAPVPWLAGILTKSHHYWSQRPVPRFSVCFFETNVLTSRHDLLYGRPPLTPYLAGLNFPAMSAAPSDSAIRLRGVRHNNLKNFDLDLPAGKLIVITGLSGS